MVENVGSRRSEKASADDQTGRRAGAFPSPRPTDAHRSLIEGGRQTTGRTLTSAIEIFLADGCGELGMRWIAAKSGLSLSNLQHYFPSREDIFVAIIHTTLVDYADSFDDLRADVTVTPEARLERLVRLLIENNMQSKTQSLFVNLLALAQSQEFARRAIEDVYTFQLRMIEEFVADINPSLSPGVLGRRSALISAQIEGLMVFVPQRNRFPFDLKGLEDDTVKAVLALAAMP